jgi:hypothetical protein
MFVETPLDNRAVVHFAAGAAALRPFRLPGNVADL